MRKQILRVNLLLIILNLAVITSIYLLLDYAVVRDKNNIVKAGVVNHMNELYYKKVLMLRDIPEHLLTEEVRTLVKEYSKKTKFSLGKVQWKEDEVADVQISLFSYDVGKAYIDSIEYIEQKYNVKLNKINKMDYKSAINKEFEKNIKLLRTQDFLYHLEVEIPEYSLYNNYIDIQTKTLYNAKVKPNSRFSAMYMNNLGFIDYINRKE